MAIFKRRKNQTVAELEEYYASKKTRSGMAWVMAFTSLLLTILVVAGLFFGVRWVYRSLTDDNLEVTVTTVDVSGDQESSDMNIDESAENSNEPEPTENFPSVVSDEAASTTTPSTSSPVASAPSTPATGGGNIPNTGAGEVLIVAPIIAMVVGYLISRKYQLQNK
ncbi:hypothetical protein KBB49_04320 [Candidatus Saccharibacteria bacterium]|nr:hypothetical protein [Candidatus Saccharibacteria bacterium]